MSENGIGPGWDCCLLAGTTPLIGALPELTGCAGVTRQRKISLTSGRVNAQYTVSISISIRVEHNRISASFPFISQYMTFLRVVYRGRETTNLLALKASSRQVSLVWRQNTPLPTKGVLTKNYI